jgi:trigger factor
MIDIYFDKLYRYPRIQECVSIAVPFKKGELKDISEVAVLQNGRECVIQPRVTAWHNDGSVKYLFISFMADLPANKRAKLILVTDKKEYDDGIKASIQCQSIISTDKVVEDKISEQMDDQTTYTDVNRGAQKSDKVTFSYSGTSGGLAVDDFTGSDYSMVLGKDAFPVAGTELADELYDMVAGQTKVITVTMPDNSKYTDYAGKRVVFELSMSYVQQPNVPMLTDAFVKDTFGLETVDQYKEYVTNDVKSTIDNKVSEAKNEAILTQLLDVCKVTGYPEEFLAEQTSKLEESISFYSTLQGKNNDEYCQNLYGKTFDEFVKASAGQQLVYQAIAEKEGLNITEYEYKDDLEQFAKDSGYSQVSTFTDKFDKNTIAKAMLVKKAQNVVMDSAVVNEK